MSKDRAERPEPTKSSKSKSSKTPAEADSCEHTKPCSGSCKSPPSEGEPCDRREAMITGSTMLMAGGLLGGYGMFFSMAGRYFYPSQSNNAWLFVGAAEGIAPGESVPFKSPTGVQVSITRKVEPRREETAESKGSKSKVSKSEAREEGGEDSITAESFLALSSVCPHLGCRVHWEGQNNRFFCPCHNGIFDPNGKATGGPPASAGQDLPEYPLKVVDGGLYIEMPFRGVTRHVT